MKIIDCIKELGNTVLETTCLSTIIVFLYCFQSILLPLRNKIKLTELHKLTRLF